MSFFDWSIGPDAGPDVDELLITWKLGVSSGPGVGWEIILSFSIWANAFDLICLGSDDSMTLFSMAARRLMEVWPILKGYTRPMFDVGAGDCYYAYDAY